MLNLLSPENDARPKILVVDDYAANRVALKRTLGKVDAEVLVADSGNAALTLMLDHDFALVLLDVQMPDLDGFEVAELMRGEERTKATPIIFVTAAYKEDAHQMRGYESGAVDYLPKPINEIALLAKVRTFLELDATARALRRALSQLEEANRVLADDANKARRSEASLHRLSTTVFSGANEGIMITDANNKVQAINTAFAEISGHSPADIVGKSPSILKSGQHNADFFKEMWSHLHLTNKWQGEVWNRHKDGGLYLQSLSISAIRNDEGSVTNYVAIVTDITRRKSDEEAVWRKANFDGLTGLPNRALFFERMSCAIVDAQRNRENIALLFVDLDSFKPINDTLGHAIGDLLLQEAAARLSACVRNNDTVARFGGDEFTLILKNIHDVGNAANVARNIISDMSRPFVLNGNTVNIGASIGISLFPEDADTSGALLRNADIAMYAAKKAGRNDFAFFAREMDDRIQKSVRLGNDLHGAAERGEFRLYYQPIVDAHTQAVVSAEALIRWQHPQRGFLPPGEFIAIAEESGAISAMTDWILETACRDVAIWPRSQSGAPLRVAINLSNRQRDMSVFLARLDRVLVETGITSQQLAIEITESLVLEDMRNIQAIHDRGIHLAIDDFGTGYSSLSYLRKLPADVVKIDRSFIMGILDNEDDAALTTAIISIAHTLRKKVVAEGVETKEQLAYLQNAGCDFIQGYYFSKPLPLEDFMAYVENSKAKAEPLSQFA